MQSLVSKLCSALMTNYNCSTRNRLKSSGTRQAADHQPAHCRIH
jgi:hypothetical protein